MIHLKIQHLLPAFAALVSFGFMNAPTTTTTSATVGVDAELTWEAIVGDTLDAQAPQGPTKKVVTDEDNLLLNSLGVSSASTSWPGIGTVAGLTVGSGGGSNSLTGGPTSASSTSTPTPIANPYILRNYPRSGIVVPAPVLEISIFLP